METMEWLVMRRHLIQWSSITSPKRNSDIDMRDLSLSISEWNQSIQWNASFRTATVRKRLSGRWRRKAAKWSRKFLISGATVRKRYRTAQWLSEVGSASGTAD